MSVSLGSRTEHLHLSIGPGGCQVVVPEGIAFRQLQRSASRDGDLALEVAAWIDDWADRRGLVDLLYDRGISLWWFVRPHMVFYFVDLLRDVQALAAAVEFAGSRVLRIDGADAHWRRVAGVVAREHDLVTQFSPAPAAARRQWPTKIADIAVLVARAAAAVVRRPWARRPEVAALLYSVCKRVTSQGRVRYLEPTYEPILEELCQRGVLLHKLSAPSVNGWRHELQWLRLGDHEAVPIELAFLGWLARDAVARPDDARRALDRRLAGLLQGAQGEPVTWEGYDVSAEVAEFMVGTLALRVRRAARESRFFEAVFRRSTPGALLVSNEYAGLAMAAVTAARRLAIPVVAVQHGVIWQGHPGYAMPKDRAATMPKADAICVFGEFERDLLTRHGVFEASEIVVTGSPRFDLIAGRPPSLSRSALLDRLGLPPEAPLVLLSSTGESHLLAGRLEHLLRASPRAVSVIVKLHPMVEQAPAAWRPLTEEGIGAAQVRVVTEEIDLYDLLRLVDVHMSMNSTVLTEAVAFDRPNILFLSDVAEDTVGYVARDVAVRAEAYDSLADAVADVLRGGAAARLQAGRARFTAEHFHRIDGRATARAANLVEQLLAAGAGAGAGREARALR